MHQNTSELRLRKYVNQVKAQRLDTEKIIACHVPVMLLIKCFQRDKNEKVKQSMYVSGHM